MKAVKPVFAIISLILISLRASSLFTSQPTGLPANDPTGEIANNILASTVQLRLYHQNGTYYEQGLGTLVTDGGKTLIVTHNHWHILGELGQVKLLNAQGELLGEFSGNEFDNLLRYSDAGTLILDAPSGLPLVPGKLGISQTLQRGDVVMITHQKPENPDQVSLVSGEIRKITMHQGLPVYHLAIQNGAEIKQGDSGGGMWFNGQLVGNNWFIFEQQGLNSLLWQAFELPQSMVAARFSEKQMAFCAICR